MGTENGDVMSKWTVEDENGGTTEYEVTDDESVILSLLKFCQMIHMDEFAKMNLMLAILQSKTMPDEEKRTRNPIQDCILGWFDTFQPAEFMRIQKVMDKVNPYKVDESEMDEELGQILAFKEE